MAITTTSRTPFEKIFLDIVGPLNVTSNGNKYILTIQDDLIKFSEAIAITNTEAQTVAEKFVTHVICKHGTPQQLLTDQGSNFLSSMFKSVCKLLKIKKIQTTPYHPEGNCALERSHKTLAEYLRHFTFTLRNMYIQYYPHTSTNFRPFQILYGYEATFPSAIQKTSDPLYNYDDYVQ